MKTASRNADAHRDRPVHHHEVLLLCARCGRNHEIDDHPLDGALRAVAGTARFEVTRQVVELEGVFAG